MIVKVSQDTKTKITIVAFAVSFVVPNCIWNSFAASLYLSLLYWSRHVNKKVLTVNDVKETNVDKNKQE